MITIIAKSIILIYIHTVISLFSGVPDSNLLGSGVESLPNRTFNSAAWNTEQADLFHAGMYF